MKYLTSIITILFSVCCFSCQEDFNENDKNSNFSFLSIRPNSDMDNISQSDLNIVVKAIPRFKIFENENGLLEIKPRSPKEINVSENIFSFVQQIIDNTNNLQLSDLTVSRSPLLRSGESDYYRHNDCAAWAVSAATGRSYNEVSSYITSHYGYDGVTTSELIGVAAHFSGTTPKRVSKSELASMSALGNNYLIIYGDHVVNGLYVSDNSILCKDYQNGSLVYIPFNKLTAVYKI